MAPNRLSFVTTLEGETQVNQEDAVNQFVDENETRADASEMDILRVPSAVVAAGVVAAVVGVGVLGWLLFRSRRRLTLVRRLQDAIPANVREFPNELGARIRRAR